MNRKPPRSEHDASTNRTRAPADRKRLSALAYGLTESSRFGIGAIYRHIGSPRPVGDGNANLHPNGDADGDV